MNLENKDGGIYADGEKIADYNSEKHEVTSDHELSRVLKGQINSLFEEKAAYVVVAVEGETKNVPPEPEMTKHQGDRTPAWAEWCRRYYPERFAKHFNDLRPYETPQVEEE